MLPNNSTHQQFNKKQLPTHLLPNSGSQTFFEYGYDNECEYDSKHFNNSTLFFKHEGTSINLSRVSITLLIPTCRGSARLVLKGISINLLRTMITSLIGARNPHVLRVHSGFCAPFASHSRRSRQFIEVPSRHSRQLIAVSMRRKVVLLM